MPKLKNWSREKLPVGSIRIRKRKNGRRTIRVRFIKVRNGGPKSGQWIPLATHWWKKNRGAVPPGLRVVHLDGNTLNDDPENYGLLTAGDVMYLAHERDPEMSERNRLACIEGTRKTNVLRGRMNRALNWLPTRWYAVFHEEKAVINQPFKSLRQLLAWHGVSVSLNGRIPKSAELEFEAMRGVAIARNFNNYRKVEPDDDSR